ncbi:caspase family protein [Candidatus Parabeggiatoa sp. HSG14]|uniref:caspase family protein n=1 Tax=Candidatus Parabeggiatoa sp. HSG14 TaxID=3055593 RepID=UPI0025A6C6FA|nr:caspase family protein [Thiotrichales bacterium HSG14]
MKQILTFFVIALLVGGCQSPQTTDLNTPIDNDSIIKPRTINETGTIPSEIVQHPVPNSLQKALVIGNGDYDYSPLQNPVNDAKAMTDALFNLGFHVTRATNLDHQTMKNVVEDFKNKLSPNGIALFYFSGHGAQVHGENFLLPVNNDINGEDELQKKAISAQNVLAMMKDVNKGVNLLVLDACRNNPYKGEKRGTPRGLARMESPRGALIAFAAAPGQAASDGDGYNGLYTSHLLDALKNAKHKRIEDVFMEVQSPVVDKSNGKQEPWYQASFRKPFCIGGCF